MVIIVKVVNVEELEAVAPKDHFQMLNRRVIGENVGAKNVRVAFGVAESGGNAIRHSHANMEQIYFVIEGELRVKGEKEEVEVKKGMALFIPPGEAHTTRNPGPKKASYLVINAP